MSVFDRVNSPLSIRGRFRRQQRPQQAQTGPVTGPSPLQYRDTRQADEAVPFALRVAAAASWRLILVGAIIYALLWLLGIASTVVIPVAVALLLTALVMPLAVFLNHRLKFPRPLASITTILISLGFVIALLYVAGQQIVIGVRDLAGQVQDGIEQVQNWLANGPLQVGGDQLAQAIDQGVAWVESNAGMLTSGAITGAVTAGNIAVGLIMALFAMFFFLSDGDRMWSWCVRLAPKEIRTPVHEAGRRGWVSLSSYVKTQVIVAAVDAVFIAAGAALLGVPLAIPIGLIVFFAAAIPIVGAVVSGALAVLVALVAVDFVTALLMLLVVIAVQQIESNLLQPILMSKAVALHPLATLLGVAVGSYTFGIVGALFAVPIMAVTNTVVLYLNGHDKFPMLTQEASALTNSAKELTGDKHAPKHDDVPPAPGTDAPRIGDADPHRYTAQQEAYDKHMEQRAEVEKVEDGHIKGPDQSALQESTETQRRPDQGGGASPA